MKWNRYTIKTTTETVDIISSMMMDIGIEGIEIEDNVQLGKDDIKTMFVDFLPELPPDDGTAKVSFYLDSDTDKEDMLRQVYEGLEELREYMDIGEGTITESVTEDKDWINNWKQYFHPFSIGDIIIKPTWEARTQEMENHLVVNIDPGTAFGTGSHETTQMVIREMQKYVKQGDQLLDVGCGSGILSVIGLMLGAEHAVGTDLDPNAITASIENAEVNHIPLEKIQIIEGNIIDDRKVKEAAGFDRFDVVCANILADVLIPLSAVITEHMKSGAVFITSGIINTKEKEVVDAFQKNKELEIIDVHYDGEWVNVTAKKK